MRIEGLVPNCIYYNRFYHRILSLSEGHASTVINFCCERSIALTWGCNALFLTTLARRCRLALHRHPWIIRMFNLCVTLVLAKAGAHVGRCIAENWADLVYWWAMEQGVECGNHLWHEVFEKTYFERLCDHFGFLGLKDLAPFLDSLLQLLEVWL